MIDLYKKKILLKLLITLKPRQVERQIERKTDIHIKRKKQDREIRTWRE